MNNKNIATNILHGVHHESPFGALTPPIIQSSTFVFDSSEQGAARFAGREDGFIYTRLGNPTTAMLEEKVAYLEGAEAGACFASGMGAISGTLLTLLGNGDHLIADTTLYGCTLSLMAEHFTKFGINVQFVDLSDLEQLRAALKSNTKVVYFETPANPTMKVIDIEAVAKMAHDASPNCKVVVDNTFCTPIITKPLDFGTDIVVHSATKYLNGHGDVVAGICVSDRKTISEIKKVGLKDITGSVLDPFAAYLILRGIKTLKLRMDAHSSNAQKVAEYLEQSEHVTAVYYPGLSSSKGYDIAKKQMKQFSGVLSFEVKSYEQAVSIMNNVKVCTLAVSLGDCETLIQHPASMTHSGYTKEELIAAGFSDTLIRLSVGLEDAQDIICDLEQAMDIAAKA
jgi:methionine-gamma-lyase